MNILLTPARIGAVEIKNRIVMPPMTTRTADDEGFVTEECIAYYLARVHGGTGLITVEMASPEKVGRHRRREIGIYDDRFIPGLRRLTDAIHRGGAKASIQVGHAGGHTRRDICGETPIAPSAIPHPVYETTFATIVPQEMSQARIDETIAAHVAAAQRARTAGFDGVEIHAAHGYLISQFHAPFENRRTDEYGGTLENRARFGLDVLRAVKAAVPDLAVVYRLSVEDFFPGGLRFAEGRQIAMWAATAGADALHITAGHYRSRPSAQVVLPPMNLSDATFLDYAAEVKKRVGVPVIAVGRLGDPAIAERAVSQGKADFIALGRTLVAEPHWVEKVRRGEPIRRCLACNTCINEMRGGAGIGCVVNGAAGRETVFAAPQIPHGERIAVIGAGPAGLTYASLIAQGNKVTVFEKEAEPGGAFKSAAKAPLFQEVETEARSFSRYIADLTAACRAKGVQFHFATDAAAAGVLLAGFDRIVIATGASYRFGLRAITEWLLDSGMARAPGIARLLKSPSVRSWFYYRARRGTAPRFRHLARPGQRVIVIGDAARAGKSKEAIASAFAAALLGAGAMDNLKDRVQSRIIGEEERMARPMHRVKVAPKGMGLNDFVAMQEGYFAAEGLDVEFDWKTFRGTQSSWKGLEYLQRPQDRPYTQDKSEVIQGACVWGSICNASAGMGRFVADAYGVSPWAIFVRPDSPIRKPQDLKDVPVSVGMRAGSHFNVPYRLEKYLPLANIKTVNTGGFGARLRALLDGEVEAASLLPPQIAMAEQLGLRKIIEDTFHTLWWVPQDSPPEVVTGYLRALDRAEEALEADLKRYLPLWKLAVPPEFENVQAWDFNTFGRGERFVYEAIPRAEFDEVLDQVKRWGLDQYLKDRSFDHLAADLSAGGVR